MKIFIMLFDPPKLKLLVKFWSPLQRHSPHMLDQCVVLKTTRHAKFICQIFVIDNGYEYL